MTSAEKVARGVVGKGKLGGDVSLTWTPARVYDPDQVPNASKNHSQLPGHSYGLLIPHQNPDLQIFSSSYLPCWRNRDQEDGLLLSELCIAHRGSKDSRAIFGYLVGTIFVGFPLP